MPVDSTIFRVPHREDTKDDLVYRLIVAVLGEEVGMDRADRVVCAELLFNDKIKFVVITVALSFDEIFNKSETACLQRQIIIIGIVAPSGEVLDQRGPSGQSEVDKELISAQISRIDLPVAVI